ncbi:MAG TPA: RdgB/HAM1 family non-canonical purine NTP pyrophosphatase [Candidatus Dormibacteraeota bacterium]|nr:RdgB/HAM1 family non-canonical purine NTP pyrophosphatase [Candidatus Dormibacteraeota bacterium]
MADRPRLVIASGNAGKVQEYRDLLSGAGLELVAFDSEVDEVGDTYAENARLKAEGAATRSGLPSLGDDSGIELEALDGFPGVRSARLAPTQAERTAELWRRLEGRPRPWRARFVCVIALAVPGGETQLFEGECRGELLPEARGSHGFGYDPVFLVPRTGNTFGEMPVEEKRRYSHRAAALRALLKSGALENLSIQN